jgi:co-chaperonin GroES (HSP10)
MHNMKSLRGKKVLITIPELKKSNISLSGADEEKIMADAMKKWQKLEVFAIGTEVTDIKKGDMVYVQSYSLETGEKIEIDEKMRILIPENAIAIIW